MIDYSSSTESDAFFFTISKMKYRRTIIEEKMEDMRTTLLLHCFLRIGAREGDDSGFGVLVIVFNRSDFFFHIVPARPRGGWDLFANARKQGLVVMPCHRRPQVLYLLTQPLRPGVVARHF